MGLHSLLGQIVGLGGCSQVYRFCFCHTDILQEGSSWAKLHPWLGLQCRLQEKLHSFRQRAPGPSSYQALLTPRKKSCPQTWT